VSAPSEQPICSRAGCRAPATHSVVWRNPRIHAPDRRKVWLACDEHAPYLRDYLAARSFPVEVSPFPSPDGAPPQTPGSLTRSPDGAPPQTPGSLTRSPHGASP